MSLILVVDDVPALAEQYAYDLKRIGGHEVIVAAGGLQALDIVMSEPVDCVILDLEMPGVDGLEVLRRFRADDISIPVIVYTGTGNFERCVQATKLGAYSFIDKDEPMERVEREVANALEHAKLENEVSRLRAEVTSDTPLVGSSPAMSQLKEQIAKLAPIPSPVLVYGESGTGKELVARELHRLGSTPDGPFVAINCAALPDNLIESELFGHERGAFTGANRTHKGAFELAAGGTLFLDEIGELPGAAQAKLLRVLEERLVTRVGGERTIKVSARIVAATHRDLEAETGASRFREDLFYRLNVHIVTVPPLRERRSDVSELAKLFLGATCKRFGIPAKRFSPEALDSLMSYDWSRNNVRELRNIVERVTIASDGTLVELDHVPVDIRDDGDTGATASASSTFQALRAEAERQILVSALEKHDWQISNTAKALGLADHSSLLKIMRRHGLKRDKG